MVIGEGSGRGQGRLGRGSPVVVKVMQPAGGTHHFAPHHHFYSIALIMLSWFSLSPQQDPFFASGNIFPIFLLLQWAWYQGIWEITVIDRDGFSTQETLDGAGLSWAYRFQKWLSKPPKIGRPIGCPDSPRTFQTTEILHFVCDFEVEFSDDEDICPMSIALTTIIWASVFLLVANCYACDCASTMNIE